ncbi:NACHT domain-containing protein [Actinosynnema sp. NPDC059335]|uniref:NACHT domain-containing protein n=1 Tax=Actinosynnema sp. NPDC059335 TaxID=3346804 RepID=UPI003670B02C
MFEGKERDSIFITEDAINAYEFTVNTKKAKAVQDAQKLREVLTKLSKFPENRYKTPRGWFVTRNEPLADQRSAVEQEAKKAGFPLYAISIKTLQKRLCDAEGYLRRRSDAPFGSTVFTTRGGFPKVDVASRFTTSSGETFKLPYIAELLNSGGRVLLTGEFGVGKSHALRELYNILRRAYFKDTLTNPFPLHINLNDCIGLRTPAEIIRRHAENIDFAGQNGLISAWRAGACTLLLDGFDELVPQRWVGGASDLKEVRWQALSAVRRLIEEMPEAGGVIVSGRSHFFSSSSEMVAALNLGDSALQLTLEDFNEDQLAQYRKLVGITSSIPDWVPARPLLLGYLYSNRDSIPGDLSNQSVGQSWRTLLAAICEREAKILSVVRPEVILKILSRVATLARSKGNELGPVGMDEMKRAFYEINGREPEEEGLQALLRLPGLAVDTTSDREEKRVFIDRSLAGAAYGEDLAAYLADSHNNQHPLSRAASWIDAADSISIDVAASAFTDSGGSLSLALAAVDHRQSKGWSDVVVSDAIRVADAVSEEDAKVNLGYMVEGVIFDHFSADGPVQASTRYRDCLINTLNLSEVSTASECAIFDNCSIHFVDGIAAIPPWLANNFVNTAVDKYSHTTQTTAGILALNLPVETAVALSILKKVYNQEGSARKESALYRGLDQQKQQIVGNILSGMVAKGWISKGGAGGTTIYRAVKGVRNLAQRVLEDPQSFEIDLPSQQR